MNTGKTLFAQLMDFLPWTTFARYVARYDGDKGVRTLTCAEQFRVMAFAQLTYRESLRDIEACLSAQAAKLYHMGFREPIRRSTSGRCQRVARLAHLCRLRAAPDRSGQSAVCQRGLGAGIVEHGLCAGFDDHRPVPVGVSVGALSHHQGRGEDAHAARSARQHSELHPRLRRQAARRACPRPAGAGARRHLRHGSRLRRFRAPSRSASGRRLLRHADQVEHGLPSRLFGEDGSRRPASFAIRPLRSMASTRSRTTPRICAGFASRIPRPARRSSSSPTR